MNLEIVKNTGNPLFKRKEIFARTEKEVVPSKSEVEKMFSEKFSVPSENIKIKKIDGRFGTKKFNITAFIYDSKESKEKTEIKTRKQRKAEKNPKKEEQKNG
ncbi:MAG: hypothetical protein AABX28_03700 [Nanoarchaeota archaeon]